MNEQRKKRIILIFSLIIVLFIFEQCTNKSVCLTRHSPDKYESEGMILKCDYTGWIEGNKPYDYVSLGYNFQCQKIPDYLKITSIEFQVEKLDINIIKEVNEIVTFREEEDENTHKFISYNNLSDIKFDDLRNSITKKNIFTLTNRLLFTKFRFAKEAKVTIHYEYQIDGDLFKCSNSFLYLTKTETSLKLLDAIESV